MTSLSVAIPTYNGGEYLDEQIDSILNQNTKPDEIVVYDDCSTDDTVEVAETRADRSDVPIEVHENETNVGVARNFANAISKCEGDLILLCDQDDIWCPQKIDTLVREYERSATGLLCHNVTIATEDMVPLTDLWARNGFRPDEYDSSAELFDRLVHGQNFVQGASILAPAEFLQEKTPFPTYRYDYYLAVTASLDIGLQTIDQELALYRQHEDQDLGGPGRTLLHRAIESIGRDVYELQLETLKMWRAVFEEVKSSNGNELQVAKGDAVTALKKRLEYEERRHRSLNPDVSDWKRVQSVVKNTTTGSYARFGPGRITALRDIIEILIGR